MKATFLGHSAWALEMGGARVLIDPYSVSEDAQTAIHQFAAGGCDVVLVTHGAYDHVGMAFEIVRAAERTRLMSEPAVIRDFAAQAPCSGGFVELVWNAEAVAGGLHIRAIETRHVSAFESSEGEFITGMPLGFVLWSEDEPDVRVLHLGDTSVFADLRLIGQLYRPTVGFIGVGAARGFLAEMTPREAAHAVLWLGLDVALPMHFEADAKAADEFCAAIAHLPRVVNAWVPRMFEAFSISTETWVRKSAEAVTSSRSGS